MCPWERSGAGSRDASAWRYAIRSAISAGLISGHAIPSRIKVVNMAGAWFQKRPASS